MTHSVNYDIDKALRTMILNVANNNPAPIIGTVVKISDDKRYVDVNLARGGTLPTVKCLGIPILNQEVLLVFVDGHNTDPRALCFEVPSPIDGVKTYNILNNGNFALTNNNTFKYWTGGIINNNESYYGNQTCELRQNNTITSDLINTESIENSNEAITVSFLWKGGGFTLEVLNQDGTTITALPSVLGNQQHLDDVSEWSYQRFNFPYTDKIRVRFKNNSVQKTYLDGIRVWKPDDYQEWFPSNKDIEEGGVS